MNAITRVVRIFRFVVASALFVVKGVVLIVVGLAIRILFVGAALAFFAAHAGLASIWTGVEMLGVALALPLVGSVFNILVAWILPANLPTDQLQKEA